MLFCYDPAQKNRKWWANKTKLAVVFKLRISFIQREVRETCMLIATKITQWSKFVKVVMLIQCLHFPWSLAVLLVRFLKLIVISVMHLHIFSGTTEKYYWKLVYILKARLDQKNVFFKKNWISSDTTISNLHSKSFS